MYSSLLSNGFEELDRLANSVFAKPFAERVMDKIDFPLNQYIKKDGTMVIEMAVVGMKADDIKVTVKTEQQQTYLIIKSTIPELSEDEKKEIESRNYKIKKIKSMGKMDISFLIDNNLDVRKTTKKVENGLMTITIPLKEEEKPVELEIV